MDEKPKDEKDEFEPQSKAQPMLPQEPQGEATGGQSFEYGTVKKPDDFDPENPGGQSFEYGH